MDEQKEVDFSSPIRLLTQEEQLKKAEQVIGELLSKLETQREESEKHLEEGFEQAYQILLNEKSKHENELQKLFNEYEDSLKARVRFITEMVDKFLKFKGEEFLKKGETESVEKMAEFREKYTPEMIVGLALETRPRGLHVTELTLTYEMLEKAMGLPHDVKIVGIHETDQFKVVKLRLVSDREMPDSYSVSELSKVGDMFLNPEKYKVETKGSTRGA